MKSHTSARNVFFLLLVTNMTVTCYHSPIQFVSFFSTETLNVSCKHYGQNRDNNKKKLSDVNAFSIIEKKITKNQGLSAVKNQCQYYK